MGILRVKNRTSKLRIGQTFKRIMHRLTAIMKGVLFFVDRTVHRVLSYVLWRLYRVKPLRPFIKKIYHFIRAHHRFTSLAVVAVLVLSILMPVLQIISYNRQYALSSQARTLLGDSNDNLSKKITYDEQTQLYQFNKDAKKNPTTKGNPLAELQSQVGGAGQEDKQQHSIDIPRDLSKGITYYDNQMELSFKLVPEFAAKQGGLREGHLIYPLTETKGQVAYTVTNGGLKENVILYKSPGDTYKTSYFLDLPKSLEAKLIPETGEVGIYSADPTLFGNISYGSSDDQARVENARNNSEKTFLTFKIPAPVVTGLNGNEQSTVAPVESKFTLNNSTLTVTTTGLEKADYPLAIDPSVSVDSTSDFRSGNQEDNNSTIDSGSMGRSAISGGTVGSWTNNATNMSSSIFYHSSVAYNGYMYTIAGSSVRYAPISGDGSIGSWTAGTTLTGGEYYAGAAAYNGYLYVIGGGTNPTNTARYAKINSNGSIGSWESATNLSSGRTGHQIVTYNGYMYVIGGMDGSTASTPQTFNYTGSQQTYTVPAGVTSVAIDARGASGNTGTSSGVTGLGGRGGRTQTTLSVTPGESLAVYVGRSGNDAYSGVAAAYNGGSIGGAFVGSAYGAGGGGASDVRQGGSALANRKVVAGAGGGGGYWNGSSGGSVGGAGGLISAAAGGAGGGCGAGGGGTQSAGGGAGASRPGGASNAVAGSLGNGGNGSGYNEEGFGGGGGGGYYGGGGGGGAGSGYVACAGGGGSSFAGSGTSGTTHTQGTQLGNGQVIITAQIPAPANSVQYAPINADGTLGTWASTSSFTNGRTQHQSIAYNGYMYIFGGVGSGSTLYSDTQYAPINADGTLGTWASTSSFTTARSYHSAVVSQGHVYILGGNTSNLNDTQYARINTDGTISAWSTTTAFNTGRYGHTSVAYDGYIYVIGGAGGVGVGDKIQYAKIDSPGKTTSYTSGLSFSVPRANFASVAHNGFLYVIGGSKGASSALCLSTGSSGLCNDVQYAPVSASGIIGAWASTTAFPTARAYHAATVSNGYLYITGGHNGAPLNDVRYALLCTGSNSGVQGCGATAGTVGTWFSGASFGTARNSHTAVAYGGYLYIAGGGKGTSSTACMSSGSSAYCNDVRYTQINSNGSLGGWNSTSSFSTPREAHTMQVYGGYIYLLGGSINDSTYYNDVQYAQINSNGTIGTWATNANSFANARSYHASVASNGYIYVLGGWNSSTYYNDVQYAQINSNGTIGTWATTNVNIGTARRALTSTVYNGYIYALGGVNGSTFYNTSQYAQINNGGSGAATTWTNGTSFTNARQSHATIAYKGYLYLIGGINGSTRYADVQKAQIASSGSLGSWTSGGANLPTARSHVAAVASNGYVYVLGGRDAGGFLNEVQRSSIDGSGNLSSWTADTSFSDARQGAAVVAYDGYMYLLGGNAGGPTTTTFDYTGSQQTFTVPAGVTSVKIAAQGADGGDYQTTYGNYAMGGSGAFVEANLPVTPSETLYIQVGGNGGTEGGYNGGGTGGTLGTPYTAHGGGASDVRKGGTGLANRTVIAAGGGGAGGSTSGSGYDTSGGGGGDLTSGEQGEDSPTGICTGGGGGTQSAGGLGGIVQPVGSTEAPGTVGSLGMGGNGGNNVGGGGGGGYYGGGGGGGWELYMGCGGGGGSSYVHSSTTSGYANPGYMAGGYLQNGQVSITYGKSAFSDVQSAQINSNGTLGAWTTTTDMGEDRTLHAATVVEGYLYVLGGTNAAGITYNTVKYATISNGTVGTWSKAASMATTRQNLTATVVNGYMYVFGGWASGIGYMNSVEFAPINSNGTLGNWQTTQGMNNARSGDNGQTGAAYNGRLYAVGGHNGTSVLNTTEYTALQSTPRKAAYSKVVDLGTASNVTGISFTGNAQTRRDNTTIRYKIANTSGVFGNYKSVGDYSCSASDAGRYVQVFVTLDDEKVGTFRDEAGLKSSLDSVTVDYTPLAAPTEKRLRHGAFFQNETLQSFNTNNTQCVM